MSALPLPAFERRLADLDREAFQDFVADLWAARGADVTVDGVDLVVTTASGHEPRRLRVVARDHPFQTGRGLSVSPDEIEAVDTVVTGVDSDRIRAVAADADVGYVGPARLRQIALYAIDREQCADIFQNHFSQPIAERRYRETPARRIQWMLDTVGPELDRLEERLLSSGGHLPVGWVLAGALVFVLLTVGIAVGTAGTHHGGLHLNDRATETAQVGQSSANPGVSYPPGLDAAGVGNRSTLVAAHERALAGQSYWVRIAHRHSRGLLLSNVRYHAARQSVRVGPDGRQYTVDGSLPPASIGARPRPFAGTIRTTATNCTVRFHNASRLGVDRDRLCRWLTPDQGPDSPPALTGRYITRYLDDSARLGRVFERDGRTYYHVVSTDSPDIVPDTASGYQATATVAASGLVVNLSVAYETPRHGTTVPARFEYQITRVGNRSVP